MPRKILKSETIPLFQLNNQQIKLQGENSKINKKILEDFEKNENNKREELGKIKRLKIPPPLKNQQLLLNNKITEKRSKTPLRKENVDGKKGFF